MPVLGKNTSIKARAALAKSNTVKLDITGIYENDRQKFQALNQNMGVTYDANNNVTGNNTLVRLGVVETDDHTHSNKAILDLVEEALTLAMKTAYDGYEARIAALELELANYTMHTHNYDDNDGTTTTTKTTGVVN